MPYSSSFGYNELWILESLEGELRTGERLFDDVIMPAKTSAHKFYKRFSTSTQLLALLHRICESARAGNSPVVHIEAHGDKDVLYSSAREGIPWTAMKEPLTEINLASRLNLLVVMAACNGAYLSNVIRLSDRAPVWGIIGPPRKIRSGTILRSLTAFYSALFAGKDVQAALRAANPKLGIKRWRFRLLHCELFYVAAFRRYVSEQSQPATAQDRENRLVAGLTRQAGYDITAAIKARDLARRELPNHRHWYDNYRDHYFMFDLYPENRERFTQTYDDAIAQPTFADVSGSRQARSYGSGA